MSKNIFLVFSVSHIASHNCFSFVRIVHLYICCKISFLPVFFHFYKNTFVLDSLHRFTSRYMPIWQWMSQKYSLGLRTDLQLITAQKRLCIYLKLLWSFYFTLIINSQLNIRSTVNETIVMKIVLGWVLDCLGYNEKDELEFKQEDAGWVRLLHQV